MNTPEILQGLNKVKALSPQSYNQSMELSLPFLILHKKLFNGGNEVLGSKFGLNQTELDVLCALFYLGGEDFTLTPTQLYEKLLFSSGGMTKVLKKLEEKQLIQRVNNEEDKRSKLVQITLKGQEKTAKALHEVLNFEEQCFDKLNASEKEQLKTLLLKAIS